MTLKEIFATNPALLEEPEVQKLVKYTQDMHTRSFNIIQRHSNFEMKVMDRVMHSEVMIIGGTPARKCIEEVLTIYEKEA